MGFRDLLKFPKRAELGIKLIFAALALIIVLLGVIIVLLVVRT